MQQQTAPAASPWEVQRDTSGASPAEQEAALRSSASTLEGLQGLVEEARGNRSSVIRLGANADGTRGDRLTPLATGGLSEWHPLAWAEQHARAATTAAADAALRCAADAQAAAARGQALPVDELVAVWTSLRAWVWELVFARLDLRTAATAPATAEAPVSLMDQTDWSQAEAVAAAALRQIGFADAHITRSGADAGLDVLGSRIAAQVKYTGNAVGRPQVQQLVGAAGRRQAAFFARSGYSTLAKRFADERGVALFTIELPRSVRAHNDVARQLVHDGG